METLLQDLRYTIRMMVKAPGFTAVAVLTLALGIGANTAIFSVVHALLLQPLPYGDADRLVRIYDANQERGVQRGVFSPQDLDDLRSSQSAYQDIAEFSYFPGNSGGTLIGVGQPQYLSAANVSGNFFSTLQASAALGRALLPRDDVKGQGLEIVLSYGFWQRQFGGDRNVIGRTVTIDSLTSGRTGFTIVGVMPSSFQYPSAEVEAWAPLSIVTDDMVPHQRGIRWMSAIGRLKPGISIEQAQTDTSLHIKQLENAYPTTNAGWGSATVISLRDSIVGNVRPALLVLFGVVALVMLIACANIANLLLARGTSRTREIAVRSAFGAERRRLIRQLLTESLLMALLGSAVGLLLAFAMLRGLLALSAGTIPNSEAIGIEPLAVLFCLGAALVVWPLFALLPAWKSSSTNIVDALKEGARGASSGPQRTGMREMLVIGEIAMAAMLLVGSGLLLNSLWRLVHVDPGFNAARVLSLHLTVPAEMFNKEGQDEQYRNEIIDSVARVPGVLAVGGSKTVPLNGSGEPYEFGLTPFSERGPIRPSAGVYIVTPGYFQALQIPLKSGRTFTRADDQGDRRLLVVSQSMARKIWGHEDAVGKTLYVGTKAAEVIGVVGDVHNEALSAEARDTIYMPTRLAPRSLQSFHPHQWRSLAFGKRDSRSHLVGGQRPGRFRYCDHAAGRLRTCCATPFLHDPAERVWSAGNHARGDRRLRGDLVFGPGAHAGIRHSHGARRRSRPGVRPGAQTRDGIGRDRFGLRTDRRVDHYTIPQHTAVRSEADGSGDVRSCFDFAFDNRATGKLRSRALGNQGGACGGAEK